MARYVMNKNVEHNGKKYAKGMELKESHEGFKTLIAQGHASEVVPVELEVEPKAEPAQQSKPENKSKK